MNEKDEALFNDILAKVEAKTGVKRDVFLSKNRKPENVKIRMAISIILLSCKWSLAKVGRFIGLKDHSTIIHHRNKYNDILYVAGRTGNYDSVIDLVNYLKPIAESNINNQLMQCSKFRATIMAKMYNNGSSIYSCLGMYV